MTEVQREGKSKSLFAKINYIFDKKQKGQLVVLAVLILIGGVFETLSVSMMLPVASTMLKPDSLHSTIDKHEILQDIVNFLHLGSDKKIIAAMLIAMIILFVPRGC